MNVRKDYTSFTSAEMHKEVYVENIKQTEFISTMKLTTSSTGMECSKAPEEGQTTRKLDCSFDGINVGVRSV